MKRIIKRVEAENDLDGIWLYIARDSPKNADALLDRIQERCVALADFPRMGTKQDELKPGLRSHSVGHYVIFYFPLADGIDVIRVIHGAQDIENMF